jgi:hypothetical protein
MQADRVQLPRANHKHMNIFSPSIETDGCEYVYSIKV